jgi:hypothetical protein
VLYASPKQDRYDIVIRTSGSDEKLT